MAGTYCLTGAIVRACLAFTNPEHTPKIAYDRDDLAEPLNKKLLDCVGDRDGSEGVYLTFGHDETELEEQFKGICRNITGIFQSLSR